MVFATLALVGGMLHHATGGPRVDSAGLDVAPRPSNTGAVSASWTSGGDRAVASAGQDVIVVLDSSGSMATEGRMDGAVSALSTFVGDLAPGSRFALVVFDDTARLVMPMRAGVTSDEVRRVMAALGPGGGTNLGAALELGTRVVADTAREGRRAQLVIVSDGKPNVGTLRTAELTRRVQVARSTGARVSTLGLGASYDAGQLAAIARSGGGAFAEVRAAGSLNEALLRAVADSPAQPALY